MVSWHESFIHFSPCIIDYTVFGSLSFVLHSRTHVSLLCLLPGSGNEFETYSAQSDHQNVTVTFWQALLSGMTCCKCDKMLMTVTIACSRSGACNLFSSMAAFPRANSGTAITHPCKLERDWKESWKDLRNPNICHVTELNVLKGRKNFRDFAEIVDENALFALLILYLLADNRWRGSCLLIKNICGVPTAKKSSGAIG